jgi:4-hydroxybutyrate CoA-transferase
LDWPIYYQDHCVDADTAVLHIKSGDRVVVGHAVGEPSDLLRALVENREHFHDVEIVHMVCMGKGEYCLPGMEKHFRHNSLFIGGSAREAVFEGRGDYTPCYFSEIPSLFTDGVLPVDVALIHVSPPDHTGHCSLGVSVDYTAAAADAAKIVIAQVNCQMPRTMGESFIHVSSIDWFVRHDEPIIQLSPISATEVERGIAKECAKLIEDGSTLQLGIGSLPDAVLNCIKDKKDLGIHSEMISDGVANLAEMGVINCSKKTLLKGKIVVSFLMGTKRLYDFADNNPMIHMAPVSWVNDPYVIRQNDRMVSINSCVQVDLMGQVCSESIGLKQISAVGGQVDFVRGANMSKGGKSIIAMPSTIGNGKISKIVPFLDQGAAVTTSRGDVSYIVTEFGIASLKGKTLRERAKLLISIAHPNFQPMLREEWELRFHEKFTR